MAEQKCQGSGPAQLDKIVKESKNFVAAIEKNVHADPLRPWYDIRT